MRKIFYILCVILTIFSLVVCGNTKVDESGIESDNQSNTANSTIREEEIEQNETKQTKIVQLLVKKSIDLDNIFNGINGCAVLYLPDNNQYLYYNEDICKKKVSPFSTFKIISVLLGLQNDVINDKSSTMNYNGTQYPNAEWNSNLSLKEAFQTSCIWYFRQVIDTVGESKVQEALDSLQYGNCDISEWEGSSINSFDELNGFWLDSSLKISPIEQVQVLSKIFEGESEFDSSNVENLKNILLVDDNGTKKVYGKTGTGINGEAWFVGFSEENDSRNYFAIYLENNEQRTDISGNTAKKIAIEIIER